LFDVGHGMGSFSFEVAETAIGAGFLPDTISTDLQNRHAGQSPQHDLPLVMSKLSAAGMTDTDLFRAVTATPAAVLGIEDEAGSLPVCEFFDSPAVGWNKRCAVPAIRMGIDLSSAGTALRSFQPTENSQPLRAGSTADLVVLDRKPDIAMSDVHGEIRSGNRFSACCVVREGQLVIGN